MVERTAATGSGGLVELHDLDMSFTMPCALPGQLAGTGAGQGHNLLAESNSGRHAVFAKLFCFLFEDIIFASLWAAAYEEEDGRGFGPSSVKQQYWWFHHGSLARTVSLKSFQSLATEMPSWST